MNKIKPLALSVCLAASVSAAHAEGKFTLGAGVGIVENPYKQYDADVFPVPAISYESDSFWFRGLGGGYYLWNDNTDKLSVTAYWSPMYFKPGDSDSEQMRKLDRRKNNHDGRALLCPQHAVRLLAYYACGRHAG
ncbi:MltA-interacting protein precursor [Raoultella planticola]|uniref:MltA-interacting protein n=1 Tax=Raoultella planticola TaxID=575 RepID=A0A485CFZ0_RAOPL|nr:MltA-interacting protein precursor [Raoultella planticola]